MEAPLRKESYEHLIKGEEYIITISLHSENSLILKATMKNSINSWENSFTYEKLKVNKAFLMLETINDIYEILSHYLEEKNFQMQKEEDKLKLSFIFQIFMKNYDCTFELNLNNKHIDDLLNQILNEIQNLKNENKDLKIQIQNIRNMELEYTKQINNVKIENGQNLTKNDSEYKLLLNNQINHLNIENQNLKNEMNVIKNEIQNMISNEFESKKELRQDLNNSVLENKSLNIQVKKLKNQNLKSKSLLRNKLNEVVCREKEKIISKPKERLINILSHNSNLIKYFDFDNKRVNCYRVDAQIHIDSYLDFDKLNYMEWFKPDSSKEVNDIVDYFHLEYEQHGLPWFCWIITYGVRIDPESKVVSGFSVDVNGKGIGDGDDGIPGKCNGSGFSAFRKGYVSFSSFSNPQYYGKLCYSNDIHKHSVICLQTKYS
jgi:hypothetical protein